MSKFLCFLRKNTSLMLVVMVLFTIVQLPVLAEEENIQTGGTVLTESGFTIFEKQESSTGAIMLNTNSGSNVLEESITGEIVLEERSLTGSDVLPVVEEVFLFFVGVITNKAVYDPNLIF